MDETTTPTPDPTGSTPTPTPEPSSSPSSTTTQEPVSTSSEPSPTTVEPALSETGSCGTVETPCVVAPSSDFHDSVLVAWALALFLLAAIFTSQMRRP